MYERTSASLTGPVCIFFSLDAGSAVAVQAARTLLNLPYHTASMTVERRANAVEYRSVREPGGHPEFHGMYAPIGAPLTSAEGSLEYFLTERYCLYHVDRNGIPFCLEIHHPPWVLQPAEAELTKNTMAEASGLTITGRPLLHFVKRQDAVAWLPRRLGGRESSSGNHTPK